MSMTWVATEGLDKGGPGYYDRHPGRCGLGIVAPLSLSELCREPIFTPNFLILLFFLRLPLSPLLRHIMSHVVDLEAQQQVAQVTVAPRATGEFFFSSFLITVEASGNGLRPRGRCGRSRDAARNGYPWASNEQCRKFTAVRGTVSYLTD